MNFIGKKFDEKNEERFNRTWICKQIRKDLKESFGKEWKFTVKKTPGSGIDITIRNGPMSSFNEAVKDANKRGAYFICQNAQYYMTDIDSYKKICEIGEAYNYDDSNGMVDYFDRNYYLHIYIEMKNGMRGE